MGLGSGGLFPPTIPFLHRYSLSDWQSQPWEIPTAWCIRVVYGMCDSNHTTPGVTDRTWPQGCGHCKRGCPQACCGSICWSVCYGCSLKYILKRKFILKRKYQVFCSKQSRNRIFFKTFFKNHICRAPVGTQLETCSDIFLASCSSDLITLFCCGNLSPSLLEGLLGPACLSEYFSNLGFMFGTRGANQFHALQEKTLILNKYLASQIFLWLWWKNANFGP